MKLSARNSGFGMVAVVVMLAILALIMMMLAKDRKQAVSGRWNKATSEAFREVDPYVAAYVGKHFRALVDGVDVATAANDLQPTLTELANDAGLPMTSARLPAGNTLSIAIEKMPAGCTPPDCDLRWRIQTSQPVRGLEDRSGIGSAIEIAKSLDGRGAVSLPESPSLLTAVDNNWSLSNPAGQAGIVAMIGTYNRTALGQKLRIDGGQKLTSTWEVGNQSVQGVDTAGVQKLGINEVATQGSACSREGAIAQGSGPDQVLTCVGSVWRMAHAPDQTITNSSTTYH